MLGFVIRKYELKHSRSNFVLHLKHQSFNIMFAANLNGRKNDVITVCWFWTESRHLRPQHTSSRILFFVKPSSLSYTSVVKHPSKQSKGHWVRLPFQEFGFSSSEYACVSLINTYFSSRRLLISGVCIKSFRFFYTGGDVAPSVDIKLNKTLSYDAVGTLKNTDYKKLLANK